jgi:hypothetical protein
MLKKSNKISQIYLAAISILSILVVGAVPLGIMMVAHASNDPRNQACYNAGYADGRKNNSPFSQSAFNQCGPNGRAYYEGFISGCISGHGNDFFSCQRLTGLPINGVGGGSGSGDNTNGGSGGGSGFGGFNGFGGGGGRSGHGGGGGGGFGPFGGGGGGGQ